MLSVHSTIAVLSNQLPLPQGSVGCPRLCSLATEWARHHSLVLLVAATESELEQHLTRYPIVRDLFPTIQLLPQAPDHTPIWKKIRHRAENLPFFVLRRRQPEHVRTAETLILQAMEEYGCTHLHVHGIECSEFIPAALDAGRVTIDLVDSLELLYRRQAAVEKNALTKLDLHLEAQGIARWTEELQMRGYHTVVVSEVDAKLIGARSKHLPDVIPNGCSFDYFSSVVRHPVPKRMLFTGVMNYEPNVDAMCWFSEAVFPVIRAVEPQAELFIVGANPTPAIEALGDTAGIVVTGTVPDIRDYLAEAELFVCPMRTGAGIKNKILAAMSAGVPIVSTPFGMAGISAEAGKELLLADTADRLSQLILAVFSGRTDTDALVANARQLVKERYSWSTAATKLAGHFSVQSLSATLQSSRTNQQQLPLPSAKVGEGLGAQSNKP